MFRCLGDQVFWCLRLMTFWKVKTVTREGPKNGQNTMWGKTRTSLRGRPKNGQNSIWRKTGHLKKITTPNSFLNTNVGTQKVEGEFEPF